MNRRRGYAFCLLALGCWGFGQVPSAVAGPIVIIPRPPLPPLDPVRPVVHSGAGHNCALMPNASLKCWGSDNFGECAGGTLAGLHTVPWTPSTFANPILDAATNYLHTCVVLDNFTVQCFGYNADGQLGDGTTTNSRVPHTVPGIWNASRVATGYAHSCALLSDGRVLCWGHNDRGQLGDGSFASRAWPAFVAGVSDGVEIAASADHTCVRQRSGLVACWGSGQAGELGNGYADSPYALGVIGLSHAYQLALGQSHSCALRTEGWVACWGGNYSGQLGDGSSTYYRSTPGRVPLGSVDSITASYDHT